MRDKYGIAIAGLALFVASVGMAWPANPESSKDGNDCAQANRPVGYVSEIKFPGNGRQIKVYDVDSTEKPGHPPVCLSKQANDTIFWTRRSGGKFKLKISPQQGMEAKCKQHPFEQDPSASEGAYGLFSGPLRADAEVGCTYEIVFEKEGANPSDPHIRVVQ